MLSATVGVAVATLGVTLPLNQLFPPVPYEAGNRVVVFRETGLSSAEFASQESELLHVSRNVVSSLQSQTDVFEAVLAYSENTGLMLADAPGTSNIGHGIPHDLLPRLGIRPALGRFFRPEEDEPGNGQVVVLSHRWWRTRFGSDPDIVGKVIRTDPRYGHGDHTIIGVAEQEKVFPPQWSTDFYLPLGSLAMGRWRANPFVSALALVRPGVSRARVGAVTDAAAARHGAADLDIVRSYPREGRTYQPQSAPVRVIASTFRRPPIRDAEELASAALLVGLGLAILLIASLNIAGLSLARMVARRSELAVRTALGATRRRLVGALIGETTAVTALGGIVGLVATAALLRWLAGTSPDIAFLFRVDWRVAAVALGISTLAALIAVLWPSIQLGRADLASMVKSNRDTWRAGAGGGFRRVIALQVALTATLCVSAAAFIGAINRYLRTDRGFDPTFAFTVNLSTPDSTPARRGALQAALDAIAAIPGVEAVGGGAMPVQGQFTLDVGVAANAGGRPRGMNSVMPIAGNYFDAMKIRLLAGRPITVAEARDGAQVAVVSESISKQLWPRGDAVGKRVFLGTDAGDASFEVIGVARDVTIPFPRALGQVYVPYAARTPRITNIVARVSGDLSTALRAAQSVLAGQTVGVEVRRAETLAAAVRRGARTQVMYGGMLSVLSLIGLALAAAGLYGVTAYTTRRRTREFGIRLALGASPTRLLAFTLAEASRPVVSGLVAGLAGGVALGMWLRSMLLGVSPADPVVLVSVAFVVVLVALAASLHPALKVARTDPATPLRSE